MIIIKKTFFTVDFLDHSETSSKRAKSSRVFGNPIISAIFPVKSGPIVNARQK